MMRCLTRLALSSQEIEILLLRVTRSAKMCLTRTNLRASATYVSVPAQSSWSTQTT